MAAGSTEWPRRTRVSRLEAMEAALFLIVADHALRRLGFRRLSRTLRRGGTRLPDRAAVDRVVASLDQRNAARRYSCLRTGFAAAWMLRLRGFAPVLHYGVRNEGGAMRAHVWVDVGDLPVVGHDQKPGYALLASFPAVAGRGA